MHLIYHTVDEIQFIYLTKYYVPCRLDTDKRRADSRLAPSQWVTPSLIGWAQNQNQPWNRFMGSTAVSGWNRGIVIGPDLLESG